MCSKSYLQQVRLLLFINFQLNPTLPELNYRFKWYVYILVWLADSIIFHLNSCIFFIYVICIFLNFNFWTDERSLKSSIDLAYSLHLSRNNLRFCLLEWLCWILLTEVCLMQTLFAALLCLLPVCLRLFMYKCCSVCTPLCFPAVRFCHHPTWNN